MVQTTSSRYKGRLHHIRMKCWIVLQQPHEAATKSTWKPETPTCCPTKGLQKHIFETWHFPPKNRTKHFSPLGLAKWRQAPRAQTTAAIGSARKASSRATGGGTRPMAWQGVPTNACRWNQAWHVDQNDQILWWNLMQKSYTRYPCLCGLCNLCDPLVCEQLVATSEHEDNATSASAARVFFEIKKPNSEWILHIERL